MGARIVSYVFDGLYVLAKDGEHLLHVYRGVAAAIFGRLGLKIALKDMAGKVVEKLDFGSVEVKKRPAGDLSSEASQGASKSSRLLHDGA